MTTATNNSVQTNQSTPAQSRQQTPTQQLSAMIAGRAMQEQFRNALGDNAGTFTASLIEMVASDLKYLMALKNIIAGEFSTPSPEFVKFLGKQVCDKPFTQNILDQFTQLKRMPSRKRSKPSGTRKRRSKSGSVRSSPRKRKRPTSRR